MFFIGSITAQKYLSSHIGYILSEAFSDQRWYQISDTCHKSHGECSKELQHQWVGECIQSLIYFRNVSEVLDIILFSIHDNQLPTFRNFNGRYAKFDPSSLLSFQVIMLTNTLADWRTDRLRIDGLCPRVDTGLEFWCKGIIPNVSSLSVWIIMFTHSHAKIDRQAGTQI